MQFLFFLFSSSELEKEIFMAIKIYLASATKPKCRPGFLNFGPINIPGQIILRRAGCCEHCRMFSSISVLHV